MTLTDCVCGVCSEVGPADLNNFTCLAENSIGRAQAVVQVSGMSGMLSMYYRNVRYSKPASPAVGSAYILQ